MMPVFQKHVPGVAIVRGWIDSIEIEFCSTPIAVTVDLKFPQKVEALGKTLLEAAAACRVHTPKKPARKKRRNQETGARAT